MFTKDDTTNAHIPTTQNEHCFKLLQDSFISKNQHMYNREFDTCCFHPQYIYPRPIPEATLILNTKYF